MDFKVVLMFVISQLVISSSGCQEVLKATGRNVQFNFSSEQYPTASNSNLCFVKSSYNILQINMYTRYFHIHPPFTDRVVFYLNINRTQTSYWNMSITLLNISSGDEGLYELALDPKSQKPPGFCLYVLDFPEVHFSDTPNLNCSRVVIEGQDLILYGKPSQILPNNSHYDVRMTWLFNDQVLLPGGPFTVHVNMLTIGSVPATFHGANVTYRATVVGYDVRTSLSTQLCVVPKSVMGITLNPNQTLYVVTEGFSIPDIECDITSKAPTHVSWRRGEHVVANNSKLIIGRVNRTMSGEYTCTADVLVLGLSKEKSLYIHVNAEYNNDRTTASCPTVILSASSGILLLVVVIMGIVLCKGYLGKRGESDRSDKTNESPLEMAAYTMLQHSEAESRLQYETPDRYGTVTTPAEYLDMTACTMQQTEPKNQRLYESPGRSITMQTLTILPGEPRVYDEPFAFGNE